MKDKRKDFGSSGEDLAAKELKRQGYTILCRNYRQKPGEIDIIAKKADVVYFVEVKSKHSSDFATPADSVNAKKRKHIANTAMVWFMEHGECESSFLVAEVDLTAKTVFFIDDFVL